MRAILCLSILAEFTTALGAAPVPKALNDNKAKLLVGVWTIKLGEPIAAGTNVTAEFTENGKLIVHDILPPNGMPTIFEGTYKLDGDKIVITIDNRTETSTIVTLTAGELVIIDLKKEKQRFTRAVAK